MSRSRKLIDQYLTGKSAGQVLDEVDDVPSIQEIASDIHRELVSREIPAKVNASKTEEGVIYIELTRKTFDVDAIIEIYENAYPEYKILVTTEAVSQSTLQTKALSATIQSFIKSNPSATAKDLMSKFNLKKKGYSADDASKWIKLVKVGKPILV